MPLSGSPSKELRHIRNAAALYRNAGKRYNSHRTHFEHFCVSPMDFNKEIDTRGLNCPLPILRAKKALAELESGEVLKVVATDPGSIRDFAAFSKQTGHGLLESSEANREYFFYLKKK
jgi:tRNA 2-thiouridine synthesizing protein A